MKKKIKTYGLLSTGAALLATGLVGIGKADEISYRFDKKRNVVIIIAGVIAFLGATLSAFILDRELRPVDDEGEETESVSE